LSNSPVGVRIATAEDLRFVASTWFRSVLESNTVVNQVPFGVFRDGMEANIQRLLKQSVTRVVFATSQPDELLGYVVSDEIKHEPVIHHLYVKSAYRRQGIGCSLVGDAKTFTHPATPGAGKKFALALGLSYNPRLG
jgi:L-amino acid N-acyltransferase YncA